jgi:hypothetical protein
VKTAARDGECFVCKAGEREGCEFNEKWNTSRTRKVESEANHIKPLVHQGTFFCIIMQ